MRRKRSLPWIYRWSRPLIGAIAITGVILTTYLTITKLMGNEVVCSADGTVGSCGDVLNSPYAVVFGFIPLSLLGCFGYLSMATFALSPLLVNKENNKSLRKKLEDITWLLLLVGATAMAVFSGYLMYVLAFKIQAVCIYCISSALFALTMLTLTIIGRDWEDIGQIFFTAVIVAVITLAGTFAVYANVEPKVETPDADGLIPITLPTTSPEPPKGWDITTTSGESEIALAKHLTATGAKKYGAFWCPHCYEQKQLFGKEAFEEINYIECADVSNPTQQSQACKDQGISSYPTWEINGKLTPGAKTLKELAELSNYQGTTDFKYKLR